MPFIITIIVVGIGWIIMAIAFEAGWQALRNRGFMALTKGTACKLWWGLLGVFTFSSALATFLVNLPLLLVIGLSHIQLAQNKEAIVTVDEILRNIGPALRDASARIRPFLK